LDVIDDRNCNPSDFSFSSQRFRPLAHRHSFCSHKDPGARRLAGVITRSHLPRPGVEPGRENRMGRARFVLAVVLVCVCSRPAVGTAQTTAPPDGWVVLPVDEYRALRDRGNQPPPPPPAPPVDATLTRVDYDLRVDTDAVAGRAVLTIDVLREGWTRLQIPAGLMVREASLDGQPVALVDGPPPQVLLSHAGRSILAL